MAPARGVLDIYGYTRASARQRARAHTHAVLIDFPRQDWFQERASV